MFSKKTKYAINSLVFIAKNLEEQPISVNKIAKEQNIPLKFLESILSELRNARIVKSKKGKYGGYSLNMEPDKINLALLTRLFDGPIALLPCATFNFYEKCEECLDEETCGIKQIAMEIRQETVNRLKSATLSDILKRETLLKIK